MLKSTGLLTSGETFKGINPAGIYLLKVNNRNTRTRCEICSKLTIKIPERHCVVLVSYIVNFEHVIAGWEIIYAQLIQCYHKQRKGT